MLWSSKVQYLPDSFSLESDLEEAIIEVALALFGPKRIYLDVKRRVGSKGKTTNVPDGYLIDLTSRRKPVLYVVEVELVKHEPLKHIAVQILEFSLSFETEQLRVKKAIREALDAQQKARKACEDYARANGFENLDYLLETMIYGGQFSALVIVDDLSSELEAALMGRFKFPVEVVTLTRYTDKGGEHLYEFEPFLAGIAGATEEEPVEASATVENPLDPSDIDTVVVPARDDGFQEVFLGENRWYQVRVHSSMAPRIKHVAVYRVAPVSAITHLAPVAAIEQWKDTNKRVIIFAESAHEIQPIERVTRGKVKALQSLRYTSLKRLLAATNLDEAF